MDDRHADADSRLQRWPLSSLAAGLAVGALLLATAPGLPMTWDEGNAIGRAAGIAHWCGRWTHPFAQAPLGRQAIADDWRYTTQVEGHPAFYGIVIAAGQIVSGSWLSPLPSARFGPIVLFALAVGAMCYRLGREARPPTALAAAAALVLLPRLFAHAHCASFDGPLCSCWLLAWATFPRGKTPVSFPWAQACLWGLTLGMTFACKAPGWLAVIPFALWAAAYRDRTALRALLVGAPAAVVVFLLLNPPLWHDPLGGWLSFLRLNLHRGANPGLNVGIQFLGQMYDLEHPLPWYNTLFWTAVTVPAGMLLLVMMAVTCVVRHPRQERLGMLVVLNWATLLVVRALPGTPPHDGVRLFLPSFVFLALLAGIGTQKVWGWACPPHGSPSVLRRGGVRAALAAIYLGSATSLVWYAPQWLSYYNLCIGGLRGATAEGMEPTYYWDALDGEVLAWLAAHTPPGAVVRFGSPAPENLALQRAWGLLARDYLIDDQPAPAGVPVTWYVIQHRPSGWWPADEWLLTHGHPAFRKTIRAGGWGPWNLDVPLVSIYPHAEYARAPK